jgi:hypothetical protein
MCKHSPGPWTAERDTTTRKTHCWRIHSPDVRDLAGLEFAHKQDCDSYGAANARLIAAAPELLLALLTARDQLEEELRTAPGNDEADAVDAVLVEIRRVLNKLEPQL